MTRTNLLNTVSSRWKHGALRPQKPLRLIRDGEVGGSGICISNTYSLHCRYQNDSALMGSCVSHFNISLIVWAKSQDSVHKPQFLKRRERRAEADRTKVLLLTSQAPYRKATPAHFLPVDRNSLCCTIFQCRTVGY